MSINIIVFQYGKLIFNFLASPKWIVQPTDMITTAGNSILTSCIASGSPEPQITWFKKVGKMQIIYIYLLFHLMST